ncbi:hypothetical protein ANRL1_00810 [Anaerolineae bacterium]|nr:hypothetical protein ANRL1_00810 [Anaerolineae bacterium]
MRTDVQINEVRCEVIVPGQSRRRRRQLTVNPKRNRFSRSEDGAPAIHLEQLPPYAPELNPDEGVWQFLKTIEMRNLCCVDFDHLYHELYLAIRRLRRQPALLQSCFTEAGLAFN